MSIFNGFHYPHIIYAKYPKRNEMATSRQMAAVLRIVFSLGVSLMEVTIALRAEVCNADVSLVTPHTKEYTRNLTLVKTANVK